MSNERFQFKTFAVQQDRCAMKVGTDGVLLGAWAAGGTRILDVGTGTGLIALMMAQRFASASVTAIDIDEEACLQATANVMASPYSDRIAILHTALQQFDTVTCFDCIVANPPFFIDGLRNVEARRANARHTDMLSYDDLCRSAARLLTDDGEMSVVLPVDYMERFVASAVIAGLYLRRKHLVKTSFRKPPKRCLLAFCKQRPDRLSEHVFTMFDREGEMTEWYEKLTGSFYL